MRYIRRIIPIALVIVATASSCGTEQGDQSRQPGGASDRVGNATSTVSVVLGDFTVTLDQTSVPSGTVTFEVTTAPEATRPHAFSVYRTDLPPGQLPTGLDEVGVDPLDDRLELLGHLVDASEEPQALRTELAPGAYALVCNAENHYIKGMWAAFQVT